MSQRKLSYATAVTRPLLFALLMIAAAVATGLYSNHLRQSADTPRKTQGSDFQPRMLLITNEQHVTANVQLGYYAKGYNSSIGSLTIKGGHPGTFPIGIRYMQVSFSGGQPGKTLEFSILFNQDAEADISGQPFANSRNLPQNPVSSGTPGPTIIDNCALPEDTSFAQLMFGAISVASDGSADTQIAGLLNNQHPYLATGDTDVVNVMEFLPTASDAMTAGAVTGCKWLFPDSPYLGGVQWYSPAALTGSVSIGSLQGDYTVQASNPSLEDLSSLYWEFSGPTAINYILIDNSVARNASDNLFWAGVLGGLAVGFFVESLTQFYEIRGEVADVREKRENRKEKEAEKREREEARAEERREREKDREALASIISEVRGALPHRATVSQALGLTMVYRRLASTFRRRR